MTKYRMKMRSNIIMLTVRLSTKLKTFLT